MKDPSDDIRDWLYTSLSGNVSYAGSVVPVYSFPPEDAAYPYITIGEHTAEGEESVKDRYMWDVATMLEIRSELDIHDASYLPVNSISNQIMQLLRVSFPAGGYAYGRDEAGVAMNNFNVIRVRFGAFNTEREMGPTKILISKQLTINLLVEEL